MASVPLGEPGPRVSDFNLHTSNLTLLGGAFGRLVSYDAKSAWLFVGGVGRGPVARGAGPDADEVGPQAEIKLVVRADDIGSCHTANLACIQCFQEGIVRSVEVHGAVPVVQ